MAPDEKEQGQDTMTDTTENSAATIARQEAILTNVRGALGVLRDDMDQWSIPGGDFTRGGVGDDLGFHELWVQVRNLMDILDRPRHAKFSRWAALSPTEVEREFHMIRRHR